MFILYKFISLINLCNMSVLFDVENIPKVGKLSVLTCNEPILNHVIVLKQ